MTITEKSLVATDISEITLSCLELVGHKIHFHYITVSYSFYFIIGLYMHIYLFSILEEYRKSNYVRKEVTTYTYIS